MNQATQPKNTNQKINDLIDQLPYKRTAIKIISFSLLIFGVKEISTSLYNIFRFTKAIQFAPVITQLEFQDLLKEFLIQGTSAIIQTVYGLGLILKPVQKIKWIHLLIGAIIFFLPFFINQQIIDKAQEAVLEVSSLVPTAFAQTNQDQALADYQFQTQKYTDSHKQYLSAKNAWLTFKTLNSQNTAIQKTKDLLEKRSAMIRTYLFALRISLNNLDSLDLSTKNQLINQLKTQENFLSSLQNSAAALETIQQINQHSQSFQDRYPQIQVLSYQALYYLLLGKQKQVFNNLDTDRQDLLTFTDLPQSQKWLTVTQKELTADIFSETETEKLLTRLKPSLNFASNNHRTFKQLIRLLENSNTKLIQITGFLQETINSIKYAN